MTTDHRTSTLTILFLATLFLKGVFPSPLLPLLSLPLLLNLLSSGTSWDMFLTTSITLTITHALPIIYTFWQTSDPLSVLTLIIFAITFSSLQSAVICGICLITAQLQIQLQHSKYGRYPAALSFGIAWAEIWHCWAILSPWGSLGTPTPAAGKHAFLRPVARHAGPVGIDLFLNTTAYFLFMAGENKMRRLRDSANLEMRWLEWKWPTYERLPMGILLGADGTDIASNGGNDRGSTASKRSRFRRAVETPLGYLSRFRNRPESVATAQPHAIHSRNPDGQVSMRHTSSNSTASYGAFSTCDVASPIPVPSDACEIERLVESRRAAASTFTSRSTKHMARPGPESRSDDLTEIPAPERAPLSQETKGTAVHPDLMAFTPPSSAVAHPPSVEASNASGHIGNAIRSVATTISPGSSVSQALARSSHPNQSRHQRIANPLLPSVTEETNSTDQGEHCHSLLPATYYQISFIVLGAILASIWFLLLIVPLPEACILPRPDRSNLSDNSQLQGLVHDAQTLAGRARIVIWPDGALDVSVSERQVAIKRVREEVAAQYGVWVIMGMTIRGEGGGEPTKEVVLVHRDGERGVHQSRNAFSFSSVPTPVWTMDLPPPPGVTRPDWTDHPPHIRPFHFSPITTYSSFKPLETSSGDVLPSLLIFTASPLPPLSSAVFEQAQSQAVAHGIPAVICSSLPAPAPAPAPTFICEIREEGSNTKEQASKSVSGVVDIWRRAMFHQRGGKSSVMKLGLPYHSSEEREGTYWEILGPFGVLSLTAPVSMCLEWVAVVFLQLLGVRIIRPGNERSGDQQGDGPRLRQDDTVLKENQENEDQEDETQTGVSDLSGLAMETLQGEDSLESGRSRGTEGNWNSLV